MIVLDLPFAFTARVVPANGRAERSIKLVGRAPVKIHEVDSRDAPVVALGSAGGGSPPADYRAVAGGLVRPFPTTPGLSSASLGPAPDPAAAQAYAGKWFESAGNGSPPEWNFGPWNPYLDGAVRQDRYEARRWLDDDLDSRVLDLQRLMDHAAVIDGKVYVPTSGPAIAVGVGIGAWVPHGWPWTGRMGLVADIGWIRQPAKGYFDFLRADHLPQATALAGSIKCLSGGGRLIDRGLVKEQFSVDVIDPSMMPDPRVMHAVSALAACVPRLERSAWKLPDDALLLWADMKEYIRANPAGAEAVGYALALDAAFRESYVDSHEYRTYPQPLAMFSSLETRLAEMEAREPRTARRLK